MEITFKGIDSFGRPVFMGEVFIDDKTPKLKVFYGSTDKLFNKSATVEEVLEKVKVEDLVFFGNKFDCEPMGTSPRYKLKIKE